MTHCHDGMAMYPNEDLKNILENMQQHDDGMLVTHCHDGMDMYPDEDLSEKSIIFLNS